MYLVCFNSFPCLVDVIGRHGVQYTVRPSSPVRKILEPQPPAPPPPTESQYPARTWTMSRGRNIPSWPPRRSRVRNTSRWRWTPWPLTWPPPPGRVKNTQQSQERGWPLGLLWTKWVGTYPPYFLQRSCNFNILVQRRLSIPTFSLSNIFENASQIKKYLFFQLSMQS